VMGGRVASAWWKQLQAMRHRDGLEVGGWFDNNLIGVMGDGASTCFWIDGWLKGGALSARYRTLFELVENNHAIVADMFNLR
jgi:hypothetical protein